MDDSAVEVLAPLAVLAVDDHEINQRFLRAALGGRVAELVLASSGHEAIDQARARHFDLILMDLHMPDMEGSQAWKRIHGECRLAARPRVIALTADSRPEERERLDAAGFDGFLTKPVEIDLLVTTMARVARGERAFDPPDVAQRDDTLLLDPDRASRASGSRSRALAMQRAIADELRQRMPDLDAMLAGARLDDAAGLLHQWRGASGYAGANRLERACARLEQALAEGGASAPGLLYLDLLRTAEGTVQAVALERDGHDDDQRSTRAPIR